MEERDAQKKERKEETREGGNRKWIMKRGVNMNEEWKWKSVAKARSKIENGEMKQWKGKKDKKEVWQKEKSREEKWKRKEVKKQRRQGAIWKERDVN